MKTCLHRKVFSQLQPLPTCLCMYVCGQLDLNSLDLIPSLIDAVFQCSMGNAEYVLFVALWFVSLFT